MKANHSTWFIYHNYLRYVTIFIKNAKIMPLFLIGGMVFREAQIVVLVGRKAMKPWTKIEGDQKNLCVDEKQNAMMSIK